jgi:hypothetical protein
MNENRDNQNPRYRNAAALAAITAAITLTLPLPQTVEARSDLDAFLERTGRMAAYTQPLRADITIQAGDGETEEAVLIVDPVSGRQFFAIKSSGYRALSPLDWTDGKAVAKSGAAAGHHGADDLLGGLDVRPMEFFAYWAGDYQTAFISDDNRLEKTVTVYAKEGVPYILFVVTFDKEKLVPLISKYYQGEMNNLVRIRKDSDHVMVGSRPRPQKIVITDYVERTESTFLISWKTLESAPADLFSETSFNSASIEWTDTSVSATH